VDAPTAKSGASSPHQPRARLPSRSGCDAFDPDRRARSATGSVAAFGRLTPPKRPINEGRRQNITRTLKPRRAVLLGVPPATSTQVANRSSPMSCARRDRRHQLGVVHPHLRSSPSLPGEPTGRGRPHRQPQRTRLRGPSNAPQLRSDGHLRVHRHRRWPTFGRQPQGPGDGPTG